LLLGPIKNDHFNHLPDGTWFERISTITLIASVAAIGIAPYWLATMIGVSMKPIIDKIMAINIF